MNECSCIVEFDEMDKKQVNKLWEYLLEKNIKFHVLKSNDDYLKEQTLAKENQELKKQLDFALKLLSEMHPPCERDGFMDRYSDYCQRNCGVDEEIFKKCWLLYIEDKLKGVE